MYDNLLAIILLSHSSSTPGVESKGQNIFSLLK